MPTSLNYHGTLQKVLIMSLKCSEASESPLVSPAHCNKAQKNKRRATKMLHGFTIDIAFCTIHPSYSVQYLPPALCPVLTLSLLTTRCLKAGRKVGG